jgi:hypothetical protein
MDGLKRRAFAWLVLALAGVFVASSAADAARARGARANFDGTWRVSATTQTGSCDPSLRFPIEVSGGRVFSRDFAGVSGSVSPRGVVRVSVVQGDRSVTGTGRLSGNSGGGRWVARTSTGGCTGVWQAQRG